MRITHLTLHNWRNFKTVDVAVRDRLFILGPNASGKSNLLDAVRFLRDLTLDGGGFQQAVRDRGGISRVRNLAARNHNKGRVTMRVVLGTDDQPSAWTYELTFNSEPGGRRRAVVVRERVLAGGEEEPVLDRPSAEDLDDRERLTQTALEQVAANKRFREIADFFATVRYLHLVPQVIREPERATDRVDDPFGGDFLSRVALTAERERSRRLRVINDALQLAVPQLERLELHRDADGTPHLQARYKHWRTEGARQDERDFSDGTLRLIGLLWSLQERGKRGSTAGPILLEEPELSLHREIVRQLPTIFARASRSTNRQIIATTHATDLLGDEGLGLDEVLVLDPSEEGTTARLAGDVPGVADLIDSGFSLEEALEPRLTPQTVQQLAFVAFDR